MSWYNFANLPFCGLPPLLLTLWYINTLGSCHFTAFQSSPVHAVHAKRRFANFRILLMLPSLPYGLLFLLCNAYVWLRSAEELRFMWFARKKCTVINVVTCDAWQPMVGPEGGPEQLLCAGDLCPHAATLAYWTCKAYHWKAVTKGEAGTGNAMAGEWITSFRFWILQLQSQMLLFEAHNS